MKRCGKCKQEKELTSFQRNKSAKDGLHWTCKICHNKEVRDSYANNPERRHKVLARSKQQREENPEFEKARKRRYYKEKMSEIFVLLGGACEKCGVTDRRVLQIDHINGDGAKHRKSQDNAWWRMCADFIKSIKAGEREYRLLCANCNWIDAIEQGYRKSIWFEEYLATL